MIIQKTETGACFLRHWTIYLLGAPLPYVNVVFVYIHKIIPLKAKKMQIKFLINLIQGYETNQGPERARIIKTDLYQHRSIFP